MPQVWFVDLKQTKAVIADGCKEHVTEYLPMRKLKNNPDNNNNKQH